MKCGASRPRNWFRVASLAVPSLWLALFVLVPFGIVVAISLARGADAQPPYVFDLSLDNFRLLFEDALYIEAYGNAARIAATAALICLAIGYPMAYAIARAPVRWRGILVLLAILPFWTSFLVRIYAWTALLRPTGLINNALLCGRADRRAARADEQRLRRPSWHRLRLPAVHGAAALRQHREGRTAAWSRPRSTSARGRGAAFSGSRCR